MLIDKNILSILTERGAILNGHFLLKSGRHSNTYVEKDEIIPYVKDVEDLCKWFTKRIMNEVTDFVDTVVGPEMAGLILANRVAANLGSETDRDILSVYAEKDSENEGKFKFRNAFHKHIAGKKIVIIEDILTTGSSVKAVIEACRNLGGEVVGVGALVNRGLVTANDLRVPNLFCLVGISLETYDPADCPMCKEGIPINTEHGHGAKK